MVGTTVTASSITGEEIDRFDAVTPEGRQFGVRVYEKHYYRAGNRLTLTVTADDAEGVTRVHLVGGGGGEGLFGFDWGAAGSFENSAAQGLQPYALDGAE